MSVGVGIPGQSSLDWPASVSLLMVISRGGLAVLAQLGTNSLPHAQMLQHSLQNI
jgi:hypothetical protein